MAVTRLKRKGRRNKVVAKAKVKRILRLNASPVIKKVDVEKIKEEFAAAMERTSADLANAAKAKKVDKKLEIKAEKTEAVAVEEKPKKATETKDKKPAAKKSSDKKPTAKKTKEPKAKKEDKK